MNRIFGAMIFIHNIFLNFIHPWYTQHTLTHHLPLVENSLLFAYENLPLIQAKWDLGIATFLLLMSMIIKPIHHHYSPFVESTSRTPNRGSLCTYFANSF